MASIGLYYPYIQFKDEAWLKLAALYWDGMARIVPDGFTLDDSDVVRALRDVGFVSEIAPPVVALDELRQAFFHLLDVRGDELRQRYRVEDRMQWPDDLVTIRTEPGAERQLAYVYPTKMDSELASAMVDEGLAMWGPSRPDVGLGMHPRVALVYMTALATHLASLTQFRPMTDETTGHIGIAGGSLEDLSRALVDEVPLVQRAERGEPIEGMLLTLAVQYVVPNGLADVPIEKILAVRRAWDSERRRFQQYVSSMLSNLATLTDIPNEAALHAHLNETVVASLQNPLRELKARLAEIGLVTSLGAMNISTAATPTALTAMLMIIGGPVLAAAGALALGGLALRHTRKQQITELMKRPEAYLLRIEQGLETDMLSRRIAEDAKAFTLVR